jgi:phenylalanyl-tRNA synthetase alpha subunit
VSRIAQAPIRLDKRFLCGILTSFVVPGFQAIVSENQLELDILGGGMLQPKTVKGAGFDPCKMSGFAWGLSLERLAMLKYGIDDIRKLWVPPYVPE